MCVYYASQFHSQTNPTYYCPKDRKTETPIKLAVTHLSHHNSITQKMNQFCSHCSLEYATITCCCRVEAYCSPECTEKAHATHAVQCKMYRNDPCVFFEHRHQERIAQLTKVFSSPILQPPQYLLFREIMVEGNKLEVFVTHYYTAEFCTLFKADEIDQEKLQKALKVHEEHKNTMTFIVQSDKHPKYRIWLKTVSRESETVVKIIQTKDLGKRKNKKQQQKKEEEEEQKQEKNKLTS